MWFGDTLTPERNQPAASCFVAKDANKDPAVSGKAKSGNWAYSMDADYIWKLLVLLRRDAGVRQLIPTVQ